MPGHLGQADGTAWMGMYSLNMLVIALELAADNPVYEDIATKFFEHFLYIAGALNGVGVESIPLWDETDHFFYDTLHLDSGEFIPLKVRSLVGLIPLLAVETLEPDLLERMPGFRRRMRWFLANRPDLAHLVASWEDPGVGERRLLSLVHGHRMKALLQRMLDEGEFLSDHGIRSLSRAHLDQPFELDLGGVVSTVAYEPAESRSGDLRRQLQLAGAGLVPDQLPADRGSPEARPLLRPRVPRGMPDRFRPDADARGGRRGTRLAIVRAVPPRYGRSATRLRRAGVAR